MARRSGRASRSFGTSKELVGTPACIAPECLSEAALDQRIDLYALGAVAYWTLTKHAPVRARTIDDLLEAWNEPLLAPSVHVPSLPAELDDLVTSLLARDPLARPASAAYVIERLTSIADLPPEREERRVAHSYLARPPLVGRSQAREALTAAVDGALTQKGRTVLLEAAAGLGRSALLDDLALYGQLGGATVLRADGDARASAFAIARKLVHSVTALYPELDGATFASYAPDGAKLAPVRSPLEAAERHAQALTAVQNTLLEAVARAPTLIVIDDLHLVDDESLSLLVALAQGIGERGLAIIASAVPGRSEERSPAYTKFESGAARLSLGSLNEQETVQLVNFVFGGVPNSVRLAQWLKEQSGGNPGTTMDLARLLLSRGAIRYTLGTFTLPNDASSDLTQEELARANLARVNDLSARARRIASLLALNAASLTMEQLSHALDAEHGEVALALHELAERGVVAQADEGTALSSASFGAALQRELSESERRELHERIARALLAHMNGSSDALLGAAEHLLRCGREEEAAELVSGISREALLVGSTVYRWSRTLEDVLAIYLKQNRRREHSLRVMNALVRASFYGDPRLLSRHGGTALEWMSSICGMTLARKLGPFVGGKLALALGLLYAAVRRKLTPARERLGTLKEMLLDFVSMASAGAASAASAIDPVGAARCAAWLEPFAALPLTNPAALMREFALATADVGAGDFKASSERYARIMPILKQGTEGLDEESRNAFYRGCLNGRGLAEVAEGSPGALEFAAELEEDPFFAPHAECARMFYYGYRGEQEKAEFHRARAELSALRGGNSWSALTVLTLRITYIAILNHDAITLLHAINELERFSAIAPKLRLIKAIAEAWLEHMRGRSDKAVTIFERVLLTEEARISPSNHFDRTLYAVALNAVGKHERAREVCLELLNGDPASATLLTHTVLPPLALAEAQLGRHERAKELMDHCIKLITPSDNPLFLGNAHRDSAQVALLAEDRQAYAQHFEAMKRYYGATQNPSLIRQIERSAGAASRAGLGSSSGRVVHSSRSLLDDDLDSTTIVESLETDERVTAVRQGGAPVHYPK